MIIVSVSNKRASFKPGSFIFYEFCKEKDDEKDGYDNRWLCVTTRIKMD